MAVIYIIYHIIKNGIVLVLFFPIICNFMSFPKVYLKVE